MKSPKGSKTSQTRAPNPWERCRDLSDAFHEVSEGLEDVSDAFPEPVEDVQRPIRRVPRGTAQT